MVPRPVALVAFSLVLSLVIHERFCRELHRPPFAIRFDRGSRRVGAGFGLRSRLRKAGHS